MPVRCSSRPVRCFGRAFLMVALPVLAHAEPSNVPAPSVTAIPTGTVMTLARTTGTDQIYRVTNGAWRGCEVTVPSASLAKTTKPGRMDLSGATVRCLMAMGRPAD